MSTDYVGKNVRIHNLRIVMDIIRKMGQGAPAYMREVLFRAIEQDVWPNWIAHISLQDHSLEDLANLGHPYSTRFDVDSFMHPDSEVHKQGGSLAESSYIVEHVDSYGRCVCQIMNASPHYKFLRYGTRTMRMRDPGGAALAESMKAIRKRFKEEVKYAVVQYFVS